MHNFSDVGSCAYYVIAKLSDNLHQYTKTSPHRIQVRYISCLTYCLFTTSESKTPCHIADPGIVHDAILLC